MLKQRPPARSHPRERTDQATKPRSHSGGNAMPEVIPIPPSIPSHVMTTLRLPRWMDGDRAHAIDVCALGHSNGNACLFLAQTPVEEP